MTDATSDATPSTLDRRAFLLRALALGATAAVVPWLGACDRKGPVQCLDTSGLDADQLEARRAQNYVESSPHRDRTCANCQQYTPPAEAGSCGTCQIVAGPINPTGYCDTWTERGQAEGTGA